MQHTPTIGLTSHLLDHNPTPESVAWSVVSVIILLCGIGIVVWMWAFGRKQDEHELTPACGDQFQIASHTISTVFRKIFIYDFGIILLQLGMGGIIAHYTVEGRRLSMAFHWRSISHILLLVLGIFKHPCSGLRWHS